MKNRKTLVIILAAVLLLGGLASISAKTILSDYIMSLIKGAGEECGDYCFCETDCTMSTHKECGGSKTCADDGCKGKGCAKVCGEKYCDQHVVEDSEWSCNGEKDDKGRCARACKTSPPTCATYASDAGGKAWYCLDVPCLGGSCSGGAQCQGGLDCKRCGCYARTHPNPLLRTECIDEGPCTCKK